MPGFTEDVVSKVTSEAAESFAESYYMSLQDARHNISSYYVPASKLPDGKVLPSIVWNGNSFETASQFQTMFEKSMPSTFFEVDSLDAHVLNPVYPHTNPEDEIKEKEKNTSILVLVSGSVKLENKTEAKRQFSETFVLVPNITPKGKVQKEARSWLIENQNFRYVA